MRFSPGILLLWLYCSFTLFSQQKMPVKDSLQLRKLHDKALPFFVTDHKTAFRYADSIIGIAQKKQYLRPVVWANTMKVFLYSQESENKKCEYFLHKSIQLAKKGDYKRELAILYEFASQFYSYLSQYDKSIRYAWLLIDFAKSIKDNQRLGRAYTQLGRCFYTNGEYAKSIRYSRQAEILFRRHGNVKELRETLITIGLSYIDAKHYKKGLNALKDAENSFPKVSLDPDLQLQLYGNIAYCYDLMGNDDLAMTYYNKTLASSKARNNIIPQLTCNTNLGALYIEKGNYIAAEKHLKEALEEAKEVNTAEGYRDVYNNLADLYYAEKDYRKAYGYKEKFEQYSDSVMNTEKMETLENLSVKFQTKEIQDKNKLLQKENLLSKLKAERQRARQGMILYGSLGIVLLMLIIMGFLYYYYRQRAIINNNRNEELKRKLLLTQMNPHFIFNSVENIRSLIDTKHDRQAVDYLLKFSSLTRQILENSMENYIPLEEELQMTTNYLSLQQLLYKNNFAYSVAVDPSIDIENILIPPMLTQPFIENAVKHGLAKIMEGGKINVRFYMEKDALFFEVNDNGIGLQPKSNDAAHKSLATQIVADRLRGITEEKNLAIMTNNIMQGELVVGVNTKFKIPHIYEK